MFYPINTPVFWLFSPGLVLKTTIVGWSQPQIYDGASWWRYSEDPSKCIRLNPNDWSIREERLFTEPDAVGEIFYDVDSPIGHSVLFADDGVYSSLEEARRYEKWNRRQQMRAHKKLKEVLVSSLRFIISTQNTPWGSNRFSQEQLDYINAKVKHWMAMPIYKL